MLCPTCTIWHDRGTNPEPVPPPLPARAKNMVLEARGGSGSEALAGLHVAPEFVQHCPTTMTLLADLEAFVHDHRPHDGMTADATEPEPNGYRLTVACACGVVFERWVTPQDADADLVRWAALN